MQFCSITQRFALKYQPVCIIMTPERAKKLEEVINKRQNGLTVVMENVHDPHNIYAVMRTCDAVGIQDIYVLNTQLPKEGYYGIKSSSSANKWLTIHSFNNVNAGTPGALTTFYHFLPHYTLSRVKIKWMEDIPPCIFMRANAHIHLP